MYGSVVHIPVAAHVGGVLHRQAVGQVDDLVGLSVLVEGGIAGAIHLLHLPAHGRQHEHVLAGSRVGRHLDALAQGLHLGLVVTSAGVLVDGVALGALRVLHVLYEPRLGVALQGQHHLQVVAQVILRQVVAQRQQALVVAAHHAAHELHLRGVVETDVGHVGGEVVGVLSVVQERVAVLHHLDGVAAVLHAEREVTLLVGLHELARGVVQLVAVDEEVDALHGDVRALVVHVAREASAVDGRELAHHDVVGLVVERHGIRLHVGLHHAADVHIVGDARLALVGQFVGHVVSALVGADADVHAAARDGQFHVGNAGAVVEAHVALQSAGVLAGAVRSQGLAVVITLAVGHRAYLILIVLQR